MKKDKKVILVIVFIPVVALIAWWTLGAPGAHPPLETLSPSTSAPKTTTEGTGSPEKPTSTPKPEPEEEEKVPEEVKGEKLPASVLLDIPFTAQAPLGEWSDPLQQDGCEEASLIMVKYWQSGKLLTKPIALQEIYDASAWEDDHLNGALSLSVPDAARLAREYFKFDDVEVNENITIDDIKAALARGRAVVVPANGQELANPYFTPPGPAEHMLVIIGYNDKTREFITNDPGTRQGREYHYDYETLFRAIREYPTGHREPILSIKKSMMTIGR